MRMNIMKNFSVVLLLGILLLTGFTVNSNKIAPAIDKEKLLERHNYYRSKLGIPSLEWSDELANTAQIWANKLANSCDLVHSSSGYGENIYWTSGSASEYEVVDSWASEKKYFNSRNRVYKRGSGRKTGHYTQIVWKNTTQVGGAKQFCKHGGEIWVCNYDPPGNYIGQKAY